MIYTLGYHGWSLAAIIDVLRERNARLVDIRLVPQSRHRRELNRKALQLALADLTPPPPAPPDDARDREGRWPAPHAPDYLHVVEFGNVNYRTRGAGIQLNAPQQGLALVAPLLAERPVVLLCACKDWRSCHRRTVAELLAEHTELPVEHLEPPREADQLSLI